MKKKSIIRTEWCHPDYIGHDYFKEGTLPQYSRDDFKRLRERKNKNYDEDYNPIDD